MNKTLSLEVSKLLHELGVEVETERWWLKKQVLGAKVWEIENQPELIKIFPGEKYPAPDLSDILTRSFLEKLGEKLDGVGFTFHEKLKADLVAQDITQKHLEGGMESVDIYLASLIRDVKVKMLEK